MTAAEDDRLEVGCRVWCADIGLEGQVKSLRPDDAWVWWEDDDLSWIARSKLARREWSV